MRKRPLSEPRSFTFTCNFSLNFKSLLLQLKEKHSNFPIPPTVQQHFSLSSFVELITTLYAVKCIISNLCLALFPPLSLNFLSFLQIDSWLKGTLISLSLLSLNQSNFTIRNYPEGSFKLVKLSSIQTKPKAPTKRRVECFTHKSSLGHKEFVIFYSKFVSCGLLFCCWFQSCL